MSISSVDFSLRSRSKKSMKKFNIFDPLASEKSGEDNNDGDPHLVVTDDKVETLVRCEYCERTFSADRIAKHVEERPWIRFSINVHASRN